MIRIKAAGFRRKTMKRKETIMPLSSLIVVGAVIAAFSTFIITVGGIAIWSSRTPLHPDNG